MTHFPLPALSRRCLALPLRGNDFFITRKKMLTESLAFCRN